MGWLALRATQNGWRGSGGLLAFSSAFRTLLRWKLLQHFRSGHIQHNTAHHAGILVAEVSTGELEVGYLDHDRVSLDGSWSLRYDVGCAYLAGFFPVVALIGASSGKAHTSGWAVQGAFAGALLASFGLYYWHFTNEIWAQWSGVIGRMLGRSGAGAQTAAVDTGGNPQPQSSGLLDFLSRRIPG